MLFNSIGFLLFFPLTCLCYFCIPARCCRTRNLILLAASYYFYMNWQPAYALLLLTSTLITWATALAISRATNRRRRKAYLLMSLIPNLFFLFLFKYFDFLATSITAALEWNNMAICLPKLELLLPVGISFYTFQALSYSIDVYRGRQEAVYHLPTYALFVSFFPQLVAGPIERSGHLLPQFKQTHHFDYSMAMAGIKMMAWGYFLKLALADRCGLYVDAVFNHVDMHNSGDYLLATLLFPFQIYGDFAGYSLIAIGTARVMGFHLMENFRRPYFATTVSEFWHRWHISLSAWFRDYVYIPLGGSHTTQLHCCFNLLLTFLLSGIWHGANWTFLCWGLLHGLLLCAERLIGISKRQYEGLKKLVHCGCTFTLVSLAWIWFRANNLKDAVKTTYGMLTHLSMPEISFSMFAEITLALAALIIVLGVEVCLELKWHPRLLRSCLGHHFYLAFIVAYILLFGVLDGDQFIYFQF